VLCFVAIAGVSGELAKNVVAQGCTAPYTPSATTTYTAPDGFLISGQNYLVVTGCYGIGSIDALKINATTDCKTGRTAGIKLGSDQASVTIRGGGFCGEARLSADPNDNGVYGSANAGILLNPTLKGKNPVGSCCTAPLKTCGSATYTAPAGFQISGENFLVVTGCSAAGYTVVNGKNLSAQTDCTTGRTPGVKLGANVDSITVFGGGYCGEGRISSDANDLGVYGSANPGIKLVRKTIPNAVASCCKAPLSTCGNATVTAPTGFKISGENYFVVTGCSAAGSVTGVTPAISAKTDCTTGRTPGIKLGQDYTTLSIVGGGYCGESRISVDANDLGVYGSANPGIAIVSATPGFLLEAEEKVQTQAKTKPSLHEAEGAKNVARLKARVLA